MAPVAAQNPLVTGEMGEFDCAHGFIGGSMAWADAHGVSYLGWTWNGPGLDLDAVSPGGWSCGGGPPSITDYNGTPLGSASAFGTTWHLAVAPRPNSAKATRSRITSCREFSFRTSI